LAGLICVLTLLSCSGASASTLSPLPDSDYSASRVCGAPVPEHAGCLALRLIPLTAAARARTHPLGMVLSQAVTASSAKGGSDGMRPEDLNKAYFPGEKPEAATFQTIAVVDAYDDPNAASDLETYDKEFGLTDLPACVSGSTVACFAKVNEFGELGNLPIASGPSQKQEAEEWALETSTDIEMAHAVCQNCRLVLVETQSAAYPALEQGEQTAVELGADEISNSWGGEEPGFGRDSKAFEHPDTVITAAAGDDGYLNWTEANEAAEAKKAYNSGADYPASSPHVVAVGGTSLTLSATGIKSETVWNDGEEGGADGGGCASDFKAPSWQSAVSDWSSVGCGSQRAVADISADADPDTGVAVYDSVPYPTEKGLKALDWLPIGGTSVASPIIASMFALAGGANGVEYPAKTLYSHLGSSLLYDVTEGGSGECNDFYMLLCTGSMDSLSARAPFDCGSNVLVCNASIGYDGPTGVGSPNAIAALEPTPQQIEHETKEKEKEKENLPESEKPKTATETIEPEAKAIGGETKGSGSLQPGPSTGQNPVGSSITLLSSSQTLTPAIHISSLTLSPSAILALSRRAVRTSALGFSFTINESVPVNVRLSKDVRAGGYLHWHAVSHTLTIHARKGANHRHLNNQLELSAGRYLLTLTASHGAARSIAFRVP
jgi:Subtilase family